MPEFKKEGRGYKQKPFSGFKMMEEMMDNAPMMKNGPTRENFPKGHEIFQGGKYVQDAKGFIVKNPNKRGTSIGRKPSPNPKTTKPTVSSKNKADKNIIESWKREFAKIADPMESNRGKALAEKLMDAGVDPSVYARPRNRKK